jgi:glycopeptide antibiotics resistance protein
MPKAGKWFERPVLDVRWRSDPVVLLLVLWGLFIVYATLLPFNFSASGELIQQRIRRLWARPLSGGSWHDVQGNVALFVPWGFLLALWMARLRAGFILTVFAGMCTGALLSGSVELTQLFAPRRTTSVIDLITNSFGATCGAIAGWPWGRLVWPRVSIRAPQLVGARPLAACALLTGVVILISGLSPFEFKPAPRDVKAALKNAQIVPFGRSVVGMARRAKPLNWAAELLTWTLAGGLFAMAAKEFRLRESSAIAWAVTVSGCLTLAIEACQLAIPGRDADLTSVVLAVLGSAAGATAIVRFRDQHPRRLIIPALAIWWLAVMFTFWNPPGFSRPQPPYWRLERVVPFWAYFFSRSLFDVADVLGQVVIFMPLGALLAARTHRQRLWGALLIGFALGALIEVGQVFLPGRTADISDAISASAGTAAGLALWRWGESTRASSTGPARYRVGRRFVVKG